MRARKCLVACLFFDESQQPRVRRSGRVADGPSCLRSPDTPRNLVECEDGRRGPGPDGYKPLCATLVLLMYIGGIRHLLSANRFVHLVEPAPGPRAVRRSTRQPSHQRPASPGSRRIPGRVCTSERRRGRLRCGVSRALCHAPTSHVDPTPAAQQRFSTDSTRRVDLERRLPRTADAGLRNEA